MKTKTIELYQLEEAPKELKAKILQKYWDINVDYDWWKWTYEDAREILLKIDGFDIDRGNYCDAEFTSSAEETAYAILKAHGENCDTYKEAEAYLENRENILESADRDELGEFSDEYELDQKLDELDSEFLKQLEECYLSILRNEYEYLTSEEAIKETLISNEYYFNSDGEIDTP